MPASTLSNLVGKAVPVNDDLFYIVDSTLSGLGASKKITFAQFKTSVESDLVLDLTPQLGANLDVNGFNIISVNDGDIILAPNGLGHLEVLGPMALMHTATFNTNHALELNVDAAGFADTKAFAVDYVTGLLANGDAGSVLLVNIDKTLTTGGSIAALGVGATSIGDATVYGLAVDSQVNPIIQLVGAAANADSILVIAVNQLIPLSAGGAGNISVFVTDNDTVTVGSDAQFQELEFIIDTGASGPGVSPVFEFSTGVGTWTTFAPIDGTNGFKITGSLVWLIGDIPTWAVGTGGEFLIRITRTQNTVATTPILDLVQVGGALMFCWDKDGLINIARLLVANGTVLLPPMSFDSDPTKGFYSDGANVISVAINATKIATFEPAGFSLVAGLSYAIDNVEVLSETTLGGAVVNSALTSLGVIASLIATTANIDGGTLDGVTIGAGTPAPATVTIFTSTGIDDNATGVAITIAANNRVGINSTVPISQFEIRQTSDVRSGGISITNSEVNREGFLWVDNIAAGSNLHLDAGSSADRKLLFGVTQLGGPPGTTDFPTWSFELDPNTGTYNPVGNILGFVTAGVERFRLDNVGNILLGGTATPTSSVGNLVLFNGTVPIAGPANGIVLYSKDVSASAELHVMDEANNITVLSPHNFSLIPGGRSEEMAWSYYSERNGKIINVDMLKVVRLVESLSGIGLVNTL